MSVSVERWPLVHVLEKTRVERRLFGCVHVATYLVDQRSEGPQNMIIIQQLNVRGNEKRLQEVRWNEGVGKRRTRNKPRSVVN